MLKLEEFEKLEKEKKITILIDLLEPFNNGKDSIFGNLYQLIKVSHKEILKDDLLDITYKIFYKLVKLEQKKIKEKELKKLENLHKKLKNIKEEENKYKEEIDSILDSL